MLKIVLVSGVSGSGKTSKIEELCNREDPESYFTEDICSADDYFYSVESGYKFDASKLPDAHAYCLYRFNQALMRAKSRGEGLIIVDNTNATALELAPYVALAAAYHIDCELVTIQVMVDRLHLCATRNAHGVSLDTIKAQWQRLQSRVLPTYWKIKQTVIAAQF